MTRIFRAAQRTAAIDRPVHRFANPDVVCEGWYVAGSARALGRGTVSRVSIGRRDIVVYRDLSGVLHAADRACPHLGADLGIAMVTDRGLQCAFHQWCWRADGSCASGGGAAAGVRLRTYAVRERWGLAWVWVGGAPAYELPMPDPENRRHLLRLPPQRLATHGHVVLGNGLDLTHVVPVHGFKFVDAPVVELDPPHRISVHVHVRFGITLMRRLLGVAQRPARWQFTNIGPSLAWVKVTSPTPFELLWAARPLPDGTCSTQTLFFLPRWRALARAVPMMVATTWADRRVLQGLEFNPGFVASDAVFASYAQLVEDMPEW